MEMILRVRKKGVIILPKKIREIAGISEDSDVLVRVEKDSIIIKPYKPITVSINPKMIDRILREEYKLEEEKMHQYLKDSKIVLDTSVLVEHINSMSPYRDKIGELFKLGKNKLYTLPLILSETLYVVSKIYALANRTKYGCP
jgi:AbrB family looped-hinge helix DNA binding protein